jgi:mannan polymerase II complex MNN10 subunit
MSLSRSPSPRPGGGWASPGLNSPHGVANNRMSPQSYNRSNGGGNTVTWESAKAKSDGVNGGYPAFAPQGNGFFGRHMRNISNSLPRFNITGDGRSYAEKEKLGRGRWSKYNPLSLVQRRRLKWWQLILLAVVLLWTFFWSTRKIPSPPLTIPF